MGTDRVLHTLLASLRLYQAFVTGQIIADEEQAEAIEAIASNDGEVQPLSAAEIDSLAMAINDEETVRLLEARWRAEAAPPMHADTEQVYDAHLVWEATHNQNVRVRAQSPAAALRHAERLAREGEVEFNPLEEDVERMFQVRVAAVTPLGDTAYDYDATDGEARDA